MVIDTSALFELAVSGPAAGQLRGVLERAPSTALFVSAASVVEAHVSLRRRYGAGAGREAAAFVDEMIATLGIAVAPFDMAQALLAVQGFERYGKGVGGGVLNFGDCFSYALAKRRDAPLLFVGEDFRRTDVRVAL